MGSPHYNLDTALLACSNHGMTDCEVIVRGCNPMYSSLQPGVSGAATPCIRGCTRI
jgi:hypothetical protein